MTTTLDLLNKEESLFATSAVIVSITQQRPKSVYKVLYSDVFQF